MVINYYDIVGYIILCKLINNFFYSKYQAHQITLTILLFLVLVYHAILKVEAILS